MSYILRDAGTGMYLQDAVIGVGAIVLTAFPAHALKFCDEPATEDTVKRLTAAFGAFAFQARPIQ